MLGMNRNLGKFFKILMQKVYEKVRILVQSECFVLLRWGNFVNWKGIKRVLWYYIC